MMSNEIPEDVMEAANQHAALCYGLDNDGRVLIKEPLIVEAIARAIQAERERTDAIRAQAYLVIGGLLDECGLFDTKEGQRALDYFAGDMVDEDFLPWPLGGWEPIRKGADNG